MRLKLQALPRLLLLIVLSTIGSKLQAQKLLDPYGSGGVLTNVTATSGGVNSSVASAYSVRQLKTTYDHSTIITPPTAVSGFTNSTSPLLRVRRNSDNGQLDIGYDANGNLDSVTLKNFVSNNGANPTANGYVMVWYDQSGNNRDLYPPTTAAQPIIVNAGTVARNSGGQIGFFGVNGGMLELRPTATTTYNGTTGGNIYGIDADRTLNVVSQPMAYQNGLATDGAGTYLVDRYGDPATANGGTPTNPTDKPLTSLKAIANNWAVQLRLNDNTGLSAISGSVAISTSRSDNVMVVRSGNNYYLYVNGVLAGSSTLAGYNPMSPIRIGYGSSTNENVYYGEFILFPSALSGDDLNTLNISQTDYFVLGPPANLWTGAVSTDWATAANWSNATVPDILAAVVIPSGTTFSPVISGAVTVKKITINSGATLTNNSTLNLYDSLTVNGTLAGTGTVVMSGGVKQIIGGTTSPIQFNNLTISNTTFQVVTNNSINVSGTLTVNANATFVPAATAVINNAAAAGTITGSGTIHVTRIAATADYQNQYKFTTNTLTGLTVNYSGLGNQTINLSTNHGNVTVSGSGTKALNAISTAANLSGNISVTAATLDNGGFAMTGNTKAFTVSNGATFKLSGTTSTFPTGFTTTFGVSSTVEYAGTGAQIIANASYGNLVSSSTGDRSFGTTVNIAGVFTKGSNNYTASGTVTYNGTGAQTIAAINYNNLAVSGARTGSPAITFESGTIGIGNTSATAFNFTATGVGSYITTGNTFNYSGGAQTVDNDFPYNNLTLGGSGIKTTTTVTVNGILSIEGTATLSAAPAFGANSTLQFNSRGTYTVTNNEWPVTFTGSGGVILNGTNVITLNSAKTISYLVDIRSGSSLSLGIFTHSTGYLYLGGTLQTGACYGGTGNLGGCTVNTTYFAVGTGYMNTSAKTWNGNTSSAWNTANNWTPSGVPAAGTIVNIPAGTPNVANIDAASTCLDLVMASGSSLTFTASQILTITGNFVNQGGTMSSTNGTVAFSGTGKTISGTVTTFPAISISNGATITMDDNMSCTGFTMPTGGTATSFTHGTNDTLTINGNVSIEHPGANVTKAWNINAGAGVVTGNVTIGNSGATQAARIATVVVTTGSLGVTGDIIFSTSTAANAVLNINTAGATVKLGGALTLTSQGTLTANTASNFNYNGTGAQTVNMNVNYGNLLINNTNVSGATLGAAISATNVTGSLLVQSGTLNNGGFAIVGPVAGTLSVSNGATLSLGGTTSAFPTGFGTITLGATSTVDYSGTGAQTVVARSYGNLTISGARTTNSVTLPNGGNIILLGAFSPTATFTSGDYIRTGNTITFNGTASQTIPAFNYNDIVSSSTGARVLASTGTIGIAGSFTPGSNTYTTTGSTVNYNGTGAQTVAAFNYNNLIVSGARTTNNVAFESGGIVGIGAAFTPSATFAGGAYVVTNNTIRYTVTTGGQTITAFTYNNLSLINSSGTNTPGGNLVVNGTLTTTAGGTLNMGATATLTGTLGTITNNGTITTSVSTATSATPLAANKTWGGTGTVIYATTTGAQTVVAGTYNNLTLSNTSGTNTPGGSLVVNGTLTTTTGGTLDMGTTATLTGTLGTITHNGTILTAVPTATSATPLASGKTWGGTGTVTYNATTGVQTVVGGTFNNLTMANTSGTQTASGNLTINGALTIPNLTTLNMGTNTLAGATMATSGTGTLRTQATASALPTGRTWAYTVNYDAASGSQSVITGTYTNLTMGNPSGIQTASNTLTVNGVLTTTAVGVLNMSTYQLLGTLTSIVNSGIIRTQNMSTTPVPAGKVWDGTVEYTTTTGGQTVPTGVYNNLTMSNTSGTQTASDTLLVNGTLTTSAGGTLNMVTYRLTGALNTVNHSGVLLTQNTSSTPIPTGKTWGGTVNYNASSGGQTIVVATYNNLTTGNTSGTQTASGNVTVNGTLTTTSGGTMDLVTYQLLGSLTSVSSSGIILTQNTSSTPIPASKTWGGTVNYNATTGAQTVVLGTYDNLTTGNTSGTQTAGGNVTVNGTLTTTSGGTLDMTTYQLLGSPTSVSSNGTILTQNTSSTPIPASKTWGGTVNYNATTGSQTVASGTYNNLNLSNTSGTNNAGGNLIVNGAFTTTAAGILDMGSSSTLTGTLSSVTNNGTITTSVPTSTSSTPLASGKTWGGTIIYNSSTGAQTVVGGTYNNVTISGTSGKDASASVTINGILNLLTANASATKGAFDLPTGDTLYFGVAATTTGSSDVTGLMMRNHTFTPNITYPFGNPNQRITFENEPGQTIPSNVMIQVSLLSTAPTWANQSTKRLYQVSHTGGSGTRMSFRMNYLDAELAAGVDEGLLSVFSRTNGSTVTDLGWANFDATANLITITGVDLATWPTNIANQEITLATTTDSLRTWNGSVSTDWTEPRNWTPNGIPDRNFGVIIPDATTTPNDPSVPVGAAANSVVVRTGGILNTLAGASIAVFDNDNAWAIETGATFNPGNSTVTFAANRNVGHPNYTGTCLFYNLVISDSTTLTVLSNVTANISGSLSLSTTGILDAALFNNTIEFSGSGSITLPKPNGSPAGYRNLIISGSGTKTFPDTLYIAGNLINNGTVSASSSVVVLKEYAGLGQTIGGSNSIAFSNLIIGNGTPSNIAINTNITVSGNMNLLAGVVLTPAAANTIGGSGSLTGTGTLKVTRTAATADFISQYSIATLTLTNFTVDYMGTANQSVNALNYANLTISGSSTRTVTLPGSSVGVSGVFNPTGTNITYVNTGSTIDFNGSGSQTIPAFNYNNLTSSSSGSRNLASSGTIGIGGVFTPGSNSYTVIGSTVDFNGTAQSIPGFTYNNVTLSNSGTKTAVGNLVADGILNVANGITLDMTNVYTLGGGLTGVTNNGTITTAVPTSTSSAPLPSGKTWGGTVVFSGNAAQTVPAGTYTNITISGTGGGTMSGNVNASGIVNLSAANPSATKGLLETNGYTLELGLTGSNIGTGDVTGIVTRTGAIGANTDYTFGHPSTTIKFLSLGTRPTVLSVKISIGNAPGWKTGALKRYYSVQYDAGDDRIDAKFHYLDSEVQAAQSDETRLVLWNNRDAAFTVIEPRGRASYDATNNTVSILGIVVSQFGATTMDQRQWGLGYTDAYPIRWVGTGALPGDWSLPSNWYGGVPTANDSVLIPAGLATTYPYRNLLTNMLPSEVKSIRIETGASLEMINNDTIIVNGSTNAWINNGTFIPHTGTIIFNNGNTSNAVTISGNTQFYNVQAAANTKLQPASGASIQIEGTFTQGSGSILDFTTNTNTIEYNGANQTVLAPNGSTPGYSSLIINGTGTAIAPASVIVKGNYTTNQGVNYTTNNTTLTLNGSSVQNIGGTNSSSIPSLVINNNAGVNMLRDVTVGTTLTLTAGELALGSSTLAINGDFVRTSGTITGSAAGSLVLGGTTALTSSVVFTTGSQTVSNLTLNGSGGMYVMGTNITVGNQLFMNAGTLDLNGQTLNINGDVVNTGATLKGSSSSNITIGGSGTMASPISFTTGSQLLSSLIVNRSSGSSAFATGLSVTTLTLTNGDVNLGANTLTITGPLSRTNGTLTATLATLVMNGSSAQTIPASLFTSNTLTNLTVNNTAGVTLNATLLLSGALTPIAGTLATGNNLTLVSDATNTARIADGGCTTCSYISGNVKVQRYIPAVARRWRFLGSPLTTATFADWKSEIYITGSGGFANGFDTTLSNQASAYGYNETLITGDLNTGWEQPTNITNSLVVGKGYRVFIRGDRSDPGRLTGANSTQNAVTLDLVGPVNQGDITMPVSFTSSGVLANDGWCLVANPYASPYDWNAHFDNGGYNTNLDPTVWELSAQTGGYVSYNAISNAGSLTNGIIAPGAAFWVKANAGSPSLIFKEQFKVATTPLQVFKTEEGESFSIKLEKDEITSDQLIVKYMDASTANYDSLYDIRKMAGTVNLNAYGSDNVQLSLTVRPTVLTVDTIKLSVSGATGSYKMIFANSNELALHDNALLIDTYLSTVTDLKSSNEYVFSITSNAATQGLNRFYIVTGSNSALPVKLLLFGARKADKQTVALNWSTAQETSNSHFDVQRSTDGINYETIGTVKGNGTTSRVINYSFTDANPKQTNYYRLKQVDYSGVYSYSEVRMVRMDEDNSSLVLYPNPVKDVVTFSTPNQSQFVSYVVYDLAGVEVMSGDIPQQSTTLRMGALSRGVYVLTLKDEAGNIMSEKLIKE